MQDEGTATMHTWITVQEAADRSRVHHATVRRAIARGHLRAVRVNGLREIRLRPSWVDEWLEGPGQ